MPMLSPPKMSFLDPSLLMPIHRFVFANLMFPTPTSFAYSSTLALLAEVCGLGFETRRISASSDEEWDWGDDAIGGKCTRGEDAGDAGDISVVYLPRVRSSLGFGA